MHSLKSDACLFSFGPDLKPAISVEKGSVVRIETKDCFSNQITSEKQLVTEIDFSKVNPATGPIYVEGAKRGDALKVKILDVEISDRGVIVIVPGAGVLGDLVKEPKTRVCEIKDGFVTFGGLKIKCRPMIGVIGVASDEEVPCGTPGRHGGNLDTKVIGKGATVFFPVFRDGALFGLGDLHAVIGDGEVCVASCEVSGEVTVELDVVEGKAPRWPVVETDDAFYILVSDEDVSKAFREATELAVRVLQHSNSLSWEDAYMLASMVVDVEVSQLVNPRKTVRVRIPKEYASTSKLLEAIKWDGR